MGFRPLVLSAALFAATGVSADVTEEKSFSFTLTDGGRVSVENINGNVTVIGGSGNKVGIVAIKKAGKQEYLDDIEIIIDHTDDAIRIETVHPDKGVKSWFTWGDNNKGSVSYTITVPSSANLETIETVFAIQASCLFHGFNCFQIATPKRFFPGLFQAQFQQACAHADTPQFRQKIHLAKLAGVADSIFPVSTFIDSTFQGRNATTAGNGAIFFDHKKC